MAVWEITRSGVYCSACLKMNRFVVSQILQLQRSQQAPLQIARSRPPFAPTVAKRTIERVLDI